ncbi:hypothetical protein G8770_03420 [Aestuariicella hydrocarbonica]|uniref:Uncharacterized protein n=1 Tax=Pseudomaricurvus hydrocarbonicus TaxID=1470433 RepID=A0A9E5JSP3_9GAMM|nr:hypothetical protein [Aestuariicella hydrocarbonica]NHO64594.1 hypothetical protein [Aestuariicella hydrocarbonica]
MLSILSSLLPFSASAKESVVSQRRVNIGGYPFSFDLPEGFSKDLPAENLVEQLEINQVDLFDDLTAGHLLRRWWDIKEPGWFGAELGTVMLEMSVQRIHPNSLKRIHSQPYDVTDRLDFMFAIEELLLRRYKAHNEEVRHRDGSWNFELAYNVAGIATMLGGRVDARYWNHISESQNWLRYSISAPFDAIVTSYALPVNRNFMIELAFTYSVNHDIALKGGKRDFLRVSEEQITDPIINSLYLQYPGDSPIKSAVEGEWVTETTDEVVRRNWQRLVKPLFGEEAYQMALEEHKKREALEDRSGL